MKMTITITTLLIFILAGSDSIYSQQNRQAEEQKNMVRLSMIKVDSLRLKEYNSFLEEEIKASMLLEPGVLTLYAVAEKEQPNKITILEIYADEKAYQSHIRTAHFIKYKEGTATMVQSLELIDVVPLIPGLTIKENLLLKEEDN